MSDYLILLDRAIFEGSARPALAASHRARSFAPCRELCRDLLPAARDYARRYRLGTDEPLLARIADGLGWDRTLWPFVVSEVLLYSAAEIPELQTCLETLGCLLHAVIQDPSEFPRSRLAPIQQAHVGSRELTFGAAVYRPEHAGYNNAADVARLADVLTAVRPERWTEGDLADLAPEDRAEELAFAREWFPVLAEQFTRSRERGWVIVHECIF